MTTNTPSPVDTRQTAEHERAVLVERIECAARAQGALVDTSNASALPASAKSHVRVLVSGTCNQVAAVLACLPRDVRAKGELHTYADTDTASVRWVL